MKRVALSLMWLASLPAQAVDWSGLIDVRAVAANSTRIRTDDRLCKLRGGSGLSLGQAILRGDAELADTVSAVVIASAAGDRAHAADINEAWLRWNPVPDGPWKLSVRAGAFFPEMSLENNGIGWTPTRTISASAINSWIGEELRTVGVEATLLRRGRPLGSPHDFAITGGLFRDNDPIGTLLTWRGWGIGDRITSLHEPLMLADLPVYRPDGKIARQTRSIHLFRELDGRLGYQVSVRYGYEGWLSLSAMHYDNRTDPQIVIDGQYGWRTRFDHVSAALQLGGWEWLAQAMNGTTMMGRNAAAVDFRAAYLMASHALGAGQMSARYDLFSARDIDRLPQDPNGEHGAAAALAYSYPLAQGWTLVGEALAVRSKRQARLQIGEQPQQTERSLSVSLRWRF